MKAISIWQPWATLIASGAKRIETRSWPPYGLKPGQLVAIHAGKRWTAKEGELCTDDPLFKRYLTLAQRRGLWDFEKPPLGCVVAIARFDQAVPTEHTSHLSFKGKGKVPPERAAQIQLWLTEAERAFGNYAPGRWAWVFAEVRPLEPIPLRGQQGLFEWTPPAELRYLEPRTSGGAT